MDTAGGRGHSIWPYGAGEVAGVWMYGLWKSARRGAGSDVSPQRPEGASRSFER